MTVKSVEDLLELETRSLLDEAGRLYQFTLARLYWRSFELLCGPYHFAPACMVRSAKLWANTYRIDLATGLAFSIAHYHRHYHRILDGQTPFDPPICPLAYRTDSSLRPPTD